MVFWRPVAWTDREGLLQLLRVSLPTEQWDLDFVTAKIWGDRRLDPGCCPVLCEGNQVIGFGMGVPMQKSTAAVKLLAVHPAHEGKGFGQHLLSILENRLCGQGPQRIVIGGCPPNYLYPGVDTRWQRALAFFEAAGYVRQAETENLSVDLSGFEVAGDDPAILGPYRLRRAETADMARVTDFMKTHWPGWVTEVALAFHKRPIALHIAELGVDLVAFATYEGNHTGRGWFGPMGTLPQVRQQGLGQVLLKRCLSDLAAQGLTQATIPWVGPRAFYMNAVGAVPGPCFVRMEKPPCS